MTNAESARGGPARPRAAPQFVRFVAVSGVAAAANFGSRILFSLVAAFPVAIVLAYCVGLSVGFLLNRLFVFARSTNSLRRQMAYFFIVNLVGLVQTLLVSLALVHVLPALGVTVYVEAVAHAAGVAAPIVSSYFGHKYFSFRALP